MQCFFYVLAMLTYNHGDYAREYIEAAIQSHICCGTHRCGYQLGMLLQHHIRLMLFISQQKVPMFLPGCFICELTVDRHLVDVNHSVYSMWILI
jgi:hypothetical protein